MELEVEGIKGKDQTPFLLKTIVELTNGKSLESNIKLVFNNCKLAALIAKNNIVTAPIIAFFIAVLKSGAMGMQQATSVPKSLVDTITAVFIIFACMELIGNIKKSKKKEDKKA